MIKTNLLDKIAGRLNFMINASKLCLLMLLLVGGCGRMEPENIVCSNLHSGDNIHYKLSILNEADDTVYFVDQKGRCDVLLQRELFVDSISFGGIDNMTRFIQYCEKNRSFERLTYQTTISIKCIDGYLIPVWIWKDDIELNFDQNMGDKKRTTYNLREGKITVEDGFVKFQNEVYLGIKIKFHEPDLEGGFKTNILNFVQLKKNEWDLISRERINTMLNDINEDPIGYCVDTVNNNISTVFNSNQPIYLNNEMMFSFSDQICY